MKLSLFPRIGWSAWAVLGLACLGAAPVSGQAEIGETGEVWEVVEQRAADGEQCLVCRQPVFEGEIVEVLYKGRRFHVAEAMLDEFELNAERYFSELQARSALFDERGPESPAMSNGWLYFGLYVLAGLVAAAICAYVAASRGLSLTTWFFAGLAFNLLAVLVLLAQPRGDLSRLPAGVPAGLSKVPTTHLPVGCPACGSTNHPAASACSDCGQPLVPTTRAETSRA